jgi:hypothetical protein
MTRAVHKVTHQDDVRSSRTSRAAGACVAGAGALGFIGWALGIEALGSAYDIATEARTAFALAAGGISLWSLGRSPQLRALGVVLGVATGTSGVATLAEDIGAGAPHGSSAASSLVLASGCLLLLHRGTATAIARAQVVAMCAATLPLLALTGYVYGVNELSGPWRWVGLSLPSAVCFLVLEVGVVTARLETGPAARLVSETPGGFVLRRLLLPALLLPLAVG